MRNAMTTINWVLSLLIILAGCTEQTRNAQNYHVRRLTGVSEPACFEMARATLREYDFRIAEADRQRGYLRSQPSAQTIAGGTGRLRDEALRYPNRIRRTAILEIVSHAKGTDLKCRVLVERLDTTDHHLFRREHGVQDVPSGTPIQEEAGVTGRQNEVWTFLRRDRRLERQLMTAWMERLTGGQQSP